jgi:hypothetical protein
LWGSSLRKFSRSRGGFTRAVFVTYLKDLILGVGILRPIATWIGGTHSEKIALTVKFALSHSDSFVLGETLRAVEDGLIFEMFFETRIANRRGSKRMSRNVTRGDSKWENEPKTAQLHAVSEMDATLCNTVQRFFKS